MALRVGKFSLLKSFVHLEKSLLNLSRSKQIPHSDIRCLGIDKRTSETSICGKNERWQWEITEVVVLLAQARGPCRRKNSKKSALIKVRGGKYR